VTLLEPSEELVIAWLNQKGFFTLNNYRVGNKEIDLLAWNPITHEKQHVEISVSVNPVGSFYGGRSISQTPTLNERVKAYFEKKYKGTNDRTANEVKKIFGTDEYQKVLIIGLLNEKYDPFNKLQQEFAKYGVKVTNFKKVMEELTITKTRYTDARRYVQLERIFKT